MKEVLNVRHHHNKRIGIPRIVQHTMHKQGVVTYMSPGSLCDGDQGFCRSAKNVLALDRSIFNGSNVKLQPCVQIFGVRSFNNLICSFLLKKSFIQSWSQSQTLLHGTYKWLPLAIQWTKGTTRTHCLPGNATESQTGSWEQNECHYVPRSRSAPPSILTLWCLLPPCTHWGPSAFSKQVCMYMIRL